MRYADYMDEDRRLQILLILEACPSYKTSHFLLSHALDSYGHEISMDRLKADLAWLVEQGLIAVDQLDDATIATLKQRGLDAAQGRIVHPGVKRPKPE